MKTIRTWQDDLIMCPSQCECLIEHCGQMYKVYLRWRWSDPWTAELIPEGAMWQDWIWLSIPPFTHDQLHEVKQAAMRAARNYFKEHDNTRKENISNT